MLQGKVAGTIMRIGVAIGLWLVIVLGHGETRRNMMLSLYAPLNKLSL
jgi:hypothetical protein